MKLVFTINNLDDAELAECHCIAIADVYRMAETPTRVEPVVEEPVVEAPKIVEVAPTNGATKPPAKKQRGRPKRVVAATPLPVESAPEEAPDVAREKFRAIAAERGVVWLRPILIHYGAERLGDLTDMQVAEALHAAA